LDSFNIIDKEKLHFAKKVWHMKNKGMGTNKIAGELNKSSGEISHILTYTALSMYLTYDEIHENLDIFNREFENLEVKLSESIERELQTSKEAEKKEIKSLLKIKDLHIEVDTLNIYKKRMQYILIFSVLFFLSFGYFIKKIQIDYSNEYIKIDKNKIISTDDGYRYYPLI